VDYFKFEYEKFSGISIHVDLDIIKENLNPICIFRAKALEELEEFLDEVFIEDILIIDKAPYNIRILVEEIKNISLQNMIDYMEIKAKAIGLLVTSLQYKTNTLNLELKFTREEINAIYKGEAILLKNLQNPPSVSELAKELNITVYKLQKGFKEKIIY